MLPANILLPAEIFAYGRNLYQQTRFSPTIKIFPDIQMFFKSSANHIEKESKNESRGTLGGKFPFSVSIFVFDVMRFVSTAAVGRFDRSRGRSIESIGSVGSVILQIFRFFCHVGELEICLVSKFQLCATLGGRKNAEKQKCEFSEFSVRSVRYSIRFDRYCVRGYWWTALYKTADDIFTAGDKDKDGYTSYQNKR